jgi:ADP-ribose pyrophosphatase YjhB (NUDIX family)
MNLASELVGSLGVQVIEFPALDTASLLKPVLISILAKTEMAKSSKLIAVKRGKVLLVRRKSDRRWMFPGGRKRPRETEKDCLRREIKEELPKLKLGRVRLWKEVTSKNRRSGRKMSDAIFVVRKASGPLTIGDKNEIDKAIWRKPRGVRLTPTSRYVRDKLFPKK